MTHKERYQFVIDYFQKNTPEAETELIYDSPYQLLVAVILSAQCTDKRVNITTPAIFEKYPDIKALSQTNFDELFPLIKSISYPNNKTKHLIGMARKVMDRQPTLSLPSSISNPIWPSIPTCSGLVKD
jgi:endonuclease III